MTSLIDETNIHKYTLVCLDRIGVVSYYYSRPNQEIYSMYLGSSLDVISFESTEFLIGVPINLVDCMAILKDNQEARLELLISLSNTYRGIKPHDLPMFTTQK